ncbi:MAG: repressor LexA [Thermoanaerobacteraceae bacterium]|nr:repressor LexA [Thermoanaerobacteraceae bacterium]
MNVGERIRKRRQYLGMSVDELADKLGKNRATIYRYESAEIENLPLNILEPLAKALDVTPSYLMGWDKATSTAKKIPILGTIAAGTPILAEENIEDYFDLDTSIKADFALKVKGDSMLGVGIFPGDIVFIRQQDVLENGEIGAILIENEATLKRFYREKDTIILQAENVAYKPIVLTNGDVRILGKLVAVLNIRD